MYCQPYQFILKTAAALCNPPQPLNVLLAAKSCPVPRRGVFLHTNKGGKWSHEQERAHRRITTRSNATLGLALLPASLFQILRRRDARCQGKQVGKSRRRQ